MGKLRQILGLGPSGPEQIASLRTELAEVRFKHAHSSGAEITMGKFDYEDNSKLTGSQKWDTIDDMECDPHVKGALRANTLPLLNAAWEITPASDEARDVGIAEFCSANILRETTDSYGRDFWCASSWTQRLYEGLQFLRDGYVVVGLTTRRVGNKLVFDQIKWLEPSSVDPYGWKLDEYDNLIEIQRTYENAAGRFKYQEPVPVSDLALFVWDLKGARLEGRPFIRSMYGAWARKSFMQKQKAIWSQKVGAPMPIGHYPQSFDAAQVEDFSVTVKSARGSSPGEAFGVFPKASDGEKAEIEYVGSATGEVDRMGKLIDGENAEIAHAGATKTEMLGETQTGSRALGGTTNAREMDQIEAVARIFCDQFNHGVANVPGILERLVDLNFANVSSYPKLTCSKISADEGFEHFDQMLEAWKAGVIPKHEDARRQIVETLGIQLPDEAYEIEEPPPLPTVPPSKPGEEPNEPSDTEDEEEAQQVAAAARDRFIDRMAHLLAPAKEGAPTKGGRFPVKAGGEAARSAEDRQGEPRGRARHSHRVTGGA